jgi:hypothetical protein
MRQSHDVRIVGGVGGSLLFLVLPSFWCAAEAGGQRWRRRQLRDS